MIEETLDAGRRRWHFELSPGDVWAIRGYARERCLHGVRCRRLCEPCGVGCRACRISLNLRCGEYSQEEARRVIDAWREYDDAEAAESADGADEHGEEAHGAEDGSLVTEADGYSLHLNRKCSRSLVS